MSGEHATHANGRTSWLRERFTHTCTKKTIAETQLDAASVILAPQVCTLREIERGSKSKSNAIRTQRALCVSL